MGIPFPACRSGGWWSARPARKPRPLEAPRRNRTRFPSEFVFQASNQDVMNLRSRRGAPHIQSVRPRRIQSPEAPLDHVDREPHAQWRLVGL